MSLSKLLTSKRRLALSHISHRRFNDVKLPDNNRGIVNIKGPNFSRKDIPLQNNITLNSG